MYQQVMNRRLLENVKKSENNRSSLSKHLRNGTPAIWASVRPGRRDVDCAFAQTRRRHAEYLRMCWAEYQETQVDGIVVVASSCTFRCHCLATKSFKENVSDLSYEFFG